MTTDTRDALLEHPLLLQLLGEIEDGGNERLWSLAKQWMELRDAALRTPRTEDARDAVVTAAWALDALMPTGDGLRYFHAGFEVKQLRAALAALTQPEAK